jgi:hypothetical protein
LYYECSAHHNSNPGALFAGTFVGFLRLFLICWVSQYVLDFYHARNYVQEFWQPARFHFQGGIDYDIHDPYTDAFNKKLVAYSQGMGGLPAAHPNGKDGVALI